jgi:hypothetical protein
VVAEVLVLRGIRPSLADFIIGVRDSFYSPELGQRGERRTTPLTYGQFRDELAESLQRLAKIRRRAREAPLTHTLDDGDHM